MISHARRLKNLNVQNSKEKNDATQFRNTVQLGLQKLNDRATVKQGVSELLSIVDSLKQSNLPIFLNCLFSVSGQDQPMARREIVRIIGCVASVHGVLCTPFLPRIIAYLLSRLKDNDSGIRDACSETFGFLGAFTMSYSPESLNIWFKSAQQSPSDPNFALSFPLSGLFRPLLTSLEENRFIPLLQGATQCIQTIIERVPPEIISLAWPYIGQRIIALFSSQQCPMASQLLNVIGTLFKVIPETIEPQSSVLALIAAEHLQHNDWIVRRSAIEAIRCAIIAGIKIYGIVIGMQRMNINMNRNSNSGSIENEQIKGLESVFVIQQLNYIPQ
ncbi:MAG: putative ARM repeat superfamily protein [Streblomastix strix]|uniref:Putative ARM repeat superfamily protein n=1 Tax=Streblomastix strix TaxID=222440 RepID=A0A5J4VPK9_9EUKA|nr:MAG: putative ARM repeat superfamily protein [Streblomastix strix]